MCSKVFGGEQMFGLSARDECEKMIREHGDQIVDLLIQGATSEFMCATLKMCLKSLPFRSIKSTGDFELPEFKSHVVSVTDLETSEHHLQSHLKRAHRFHIHLHDLTSKCNMCKKAAEECQNYLIERVGNDKNRVKHKII